MLLPTRNQLLPELLSNSDNYQLFKQNNISSDEEENEKIFPFLDDDLDLNEFEFKEEKDEQTNSLLAFDNCCYTRTANASQIKLIKESIIQTAQMHNISQGRALILLREQQYNLYCCKIIPLNIRSDIYYTKVNQLQKLKNQSKCLICEEVLENENKYSLDCMHFFCKDTCFKQYMLSILDLGQQMLFKTCPLEGCKERVGLKEAVEFYDVKQGKQFDKILLNDYLLQKKNIIECPSSLCNQLFVFREKQQMKGKKINLKCKTQQKYYCNNCKEEAHIPSTCEMIQKWNEHFYQKEEFKIQETLMYLKENTKCCPNCKVQVEKNGGCQHMKCFACKIDFCWACLQITTNFKHSNYCDKIKIVNNHPAQKQLSDKWRQQFYKERFNYYQRATELTSKEKKANISYLKKELELLFKTDDVIQYEIQFYKQAFKVLIEGKTAFAYTFPIGFFLQESKQSYLEFIQNEIESTINKLEFHLTQGLKDIFKNDRVNENSNYDNHLSIFNLYQEDIKGQTNTLKKSLRHMVAELQGDIPDLESYKIMKQFSQNFFEDSRVVMDNNTFSNYFIKCTDCQINSVDNDFGLCDKCLNSFQQIENYSYLQ